MESDFLKAFRATYEEGNRAWNEGDFERAYSGLPEDVDYDVAPTWPDARQLHGPDEVVAFFQNLRETFPDVRAEVLEVSQPNEQTVIVGLKVIGTGGGSGVATTMEIWQVWELRGGLLPIHVREFLDRGAAVEAAGTGAPAERNG